MLVKLLYSDFWKLVDGTLGMLFNFRSPTMLAIARHIVFSAISFDESNGVHNDFVRVFLDFGEWVVGFMNNDSQST